MKLLHKLLGHFKFGGSAAAKIDKGTIDRWHLAVLEDLGSHDYAQRSLGDSCVYGYRINNGLEAEIIECTGGYTSYHYALAEKTKRIERTGAYVQTHKPTIADFISGAHVSEEELLRWELEVIEALQQEPGTRFSGVQSGNSFVLGTKDDKGIIKVYVCNSGYVEKTYGAYNESKSK